MPLTKELRSKLRSIKQTNLYWRYGANLAPTVHHLVQTDKALSDVTSRIVDDLNSNGIAVSRVEDLLSGDMITSLESETRNLLSAKATDIDDLRANVDNDSTIGKKTWNRSMT